MEAMLFRYVLCGCRSVELFTNSRVSVGRRVSIVNELKHDQAREQERQYQVHFVLYSLLES